MVIVHLLVCIVWASSLEYDRNQVLHSQTCHRNAHNQGWNDHTDVGHGTPRTAGKAYNEAIQVSWGRQFDKQGVGRNNTAKEDRSGLTESHSASQGIP